MYDGISQKYTMACSVQENSTRARPALIVSVNPSAAGRMRKITSDATPTEVQAHRYAPATLPNMARGTAAPGFSFFQARRLIELRPTQIHEPASTSTTPR